MHTICDLGPQILPADRVSELAGAAEGTNRRLFIFPDIQRSDINGVTNAKEVALHFVNDKLQPGDEVGILGFAPMAGFFIQEYLARDHQKIRKAIGKAKELRPSQGFVSGGELDDFIDGPPGRQQAGDSGAASQAMIFFGMGAGLWEFRGASKTTAKISCPA